jgi:hypothetical protein
MIASSTMVPRLPISQGKFVRKYSLSVEWKSIPAPYVALPNTDKIKKSKERPV